MGFCRARKESPDFAVFVKTVLSWNKFHTLVFHPFSIRKQQNYIARYVIYSENLEDSTKLSVSWSTTDLGNPLPLLSVSFFFEMELVINWTLYTFKHQLDNLKFSLIFIKYSCFERQSECKNVNVIKHHWPGYFLLQ